MDFKKITDRLRGEADRVRMSLYLSQSIYKEFKEACGDISPSKVIEELMKEFTEASKSEETRPKKKAVKKN